MAGIPTIFDRSIAIRVKRLEDGGIPGPPNGAAGGVLSGTYPNPGFAVDMATQAELDAVVAGVGSLFSAENKDAVTILKGQPVAIHSSGTGVVLASALNTTKPGVGIMMADTAVGFAGDVKTDTIASISDWTAATGSASLTRGPYFLSVSSGMLTQSPDMTIGRILQFVGYAVSTVDLDLSFQPTILL